MDHKDGSEEKQEQFRGSSQLGDKVHAGRESRRLDSPS